MNESKKDLTTIRNEKNITIEEMARKLEITPEKYQFYEEHNESLPIPTWLAICRILDLNELDFSVFNFTSEE